jgi:WD40 repeat protein
MPREIAQLVRDLATEERYVDIQISGRFQEITVVWSPVGDAILTSFSATECVLDEDRPQEVPGEHRLLAEGIYLLRIDGLADETVADEFSGGSLSWSPSGDLIAYSSTEAEEPQIRVFDLVTGEVTDLGPGHSPAWRPLPPEALSLSWEGAVTDNLRIRSEPNTASDTVGTLPKGTKVRVYGEAQGEEAEPDSGNRIWYRVIGGWVYSAFVER